MRQSLKQTMDRLIELVSIDISNTTIIVYLIRFRVLFMMVCGDSGENAIFFFRRRSDISTARSGRNQKKNLWITNDTNGDRPLCHSREGENPFQDNELCNHLSNNHDENS